MDRIRQALAVALLLTGLMLAACSPEGARSRGGGPGADIRNWGAPVEIHGPIDMFYHTPKVGQAVRK